MLLIDTNIFLEILLKQDRSQDCKEFLVRNMGELGITDFTLHSIGVILFRQYSEEHLFLKFLHDILPKVYLIALPKNQYEKIITNSKEYKFDFDDSYQYTVCKYYGLTLVTMDKDFKNATGIDVLFL